MLRSLFYRGHAPKISRTISLAALAVALLFVAANAHAVRPFVTDDGEVVGDRQLEVATWVEGGSGFFEHNLEMTFGVTHWLEFMLGAVHGIEDGKYGIYGPLFHAKASLRDLPDNGWTIAGAIGGGAPIGYGSFEPDGGLGFASSIYTHSFRDGDVLIHANLGVAFQRELDGTHWTPTVAFGTQFHMVDILYGVTEVFYGDPMDALLEFGGQVGLRLMISDYLQIDATAGTEVTLKGKAHPWGTLGVRFVTKEPPGAIRAEEAREARRALRNQEPPSDSPETPDEQTQAPQSEQSEATE